MAIKKITDFTELTGANIDQNVDVLAIVDVGADTTKKVTVGSLHSGSFSGSYIGDGSALTGVGGDAFPFTGDAQITGSLVVSGSFNAFRVNTSDIILGDGAGASIVANTTQNNVVIGKTAANTMTIGDYNVIQGFQAGRYGTDPTNCVVIGYNAGYAIGTSNNSVYVGYRAGYNNGSSATNLVHGNNTGIGAFALNAVNSGDNNTSLGYVSGYSVTSGAYNLFLGYYAGINVSTGNNNICIGSGSAGESAMSDQLRIGNGASLTTISASLATGDIIFPSTASADYFVGDGSQLSNLPASSTFPFTGDAQITGSLTISGSFHAFKLDSDNIVLGDGAGVGMIAAAGNNVILGTSAAGNTGYNMSGDDNVVIGHQAGFDLSTGDDNVAIGYQAGYNLDNDSNNVLIGYGAGLNQLACATSIGIGVNALKGSAANASTSTGNVAIGYRAGEDVDDGTYNNIIGFVAALDLTTGNFNTLLGYYAGADITTGDNNIIIGSGSTGATDINNQLRIGHGNSLVTISASLATGHVIVNSLDVSGEFIPYGVAHISSSNTAIGSGSGEDMTTGVQNVLIGELAGKDNTIGDGNVMVGFEAGETNTLGDKNVLIGYQAGKNFGTGTASDNNVAIGFKAGMGSGYTDANYNVFIGHQAGIDATSGDSNIGLGFNSLFELKGGSNNVALGYQTGVNLTTGAKNVMIGYEVGFKVSTGGNNIFLGEGSNGTELGGETATANQLRIGKDDIVPISASLATGDIIFPASASFLGLPTTEPQLTGSIWMSGSSAAHPKSQYLMIFNP